MNIGPYTVDREIGCGGMGIVLKATDSRDGRVVAIKLISGTSVQSERARIALVREAGATACLQHPNIVSIYDVNQHRGTLYIVMEYLDGASLDRLIRKRTPLGLEQRLQIVTQLCDALAYAHKQGIVHRDVKPANIFILRDGCVKVVDFGLAALAQISGPRKTRWNGTIPYMSPEQVNGIDIDGRSDVWSAGITLFELVAGKLPFVGGTSSSIFQEILNSPVPELAEPIPLSRQLNHLLRHALHKDRENRYPCADIFALELRRLMAEAKGHCLVSNPPEANGASGLTQLTLDTYSSEMKEHQLDGLSKDHQEPVVHNTVPAQPATDGVYSPLDIGFVRKPVGEVVITSESFSLLAARRKVLNARSSIWQKLAYLSALGPLFLIVPVLIIAASIVALLWVAMSVAMALSWILETLGSYPRCQVCRLPMWRRRTWKRFVKTRAEVTLGYRDCVAALRNSYWEDAAKLLSIYGAEHTSLYASRTIDAPYRYNLEFYECGSCIQHVARLTTDELVEGDWLARTDYVQARQAPENQSVQVLHTLLAAPRRSLFIFLDLLREISTIRVNAKAAVILGTICLVLVLGRYYPHEMPGKMTQTVRMGDEAYFGFQGHRNLPLAAQYYRLAAEKGDAYSANRLAGLLEQGQAGPADLNEALRWYRFAAARGVGSAEYSLGRFYENGIGVPKDPAEALHWYELAAKAAVPDAIEHVISLRIQLRNANTQR